jgi:UrcA family protein
VTSNQQESPNMKTAFAKCRAAALVSFALSLAGLGNVAWPGEVVQGHDRSKTESFADLDLSTSQGLQAARKRIRQMARNACAQVADMNDLSERENYLDCVASALAQATPRLDQLASLKRNSDLAQNNRN